MNLKSYSKSGKNLTKLHKEIEVSNFVENFEGLIANATHFSVLGSSFLNETGVDDLVANHTPIEVPTEITPRQGRQILFLNGFTDAQIVALFNQMPSPQKELALIEWEYSTAFIRSNPLISQMGAALGLTPTQIDQMFIDGAQL